MKPRIDIDYYAILGVAVDVENPAIQKAYRGLAKTHHPDLFPIGSVERAQAEAYLKLLNEAREILTTALLRADYDSQRARSRVDSYAPPFPIPVARPTPAPGPYQAPFERRTPQPSLFNVKVSFQDALRLAQTEAELVDEAQEEEAAAYEAPGEEDASNEPDPIADKQARRLEQAEYYFDLGWKNTRYGRIDMALECFRQAAYLDPSRKIPLWLYIYQRKNRARGE